MESLDDTHHFDDSYKIQIICGKLGKMEYKPLLFPAKKLPEGNTFEGFMKNLRESIGFEEEGNVQQSQHRAHFTETNTTNSQAVYNPPTYHTLPSADPWHQHRMCLIVGTRANEYLIPGAAFRLLREISPETIEKFLKIRNERFPHGPPKENAARLIDRSRKEQNTSTTSEPPTATAKAPPLPRQ